MSKIQEMIDRMCPDGVEFFSICKVFDMRNGYTPSTSDTSFWDGGIVPWIRMEDLRIKGRILSDSIIHVTPKAAKGNGFFRANSIIVATSATIGEHALVLVEHLSNQRFTNLYPKQDFQGKIDMFFMNYYFDVVDDWCKSHTNTSSFASVDMEQFRNYQIPVPPIEVQREIVRVLDSFSEHTAALVTELDAELAARKKQYEYYLDNLLSNYLPHQKAKEYSLGELFVFKNGLNASKEQFGHGKPIVNYVNVYKKSSITKDDLTGKVELDASSIERYRVQRGDVFFTRTSETQEEVGIASVLLDEIEDCVFSGFVLRARPISDVLLPEFCKYCFATQNIRKQIIQSSTLTTRALTNGTSLSKVRILVPSLAEQKRIVSILDRFEALTASLSEGLPAEIKARQQQYEYYRDQLLTFKRAN